MPNLIANESDKLKSSLANNVRTQFCTMKPVLPPKPIKFPTEFIKAQHELKMFSEQLQPNTMVPLQFLVLYSVEIQILTFALNIPIKDVNRFHYLNTQRPLWVLDDQVSSLERDISQITFTTTAKPDYPTYYLKYRRKKTIPNRRRYFEREFSKPSRHVSLPRSYMHPVQRNYTQNSFRIQPETHAHWRRQQHLSIPLTTEPSMPTFDSVPNDIDAADDVLGPIFVYNGPKGELIVNTMLSIKRYPMQEPVPGDILYPPRVPLFRPKPIVQRFRQPDQESPIMNLTLIPFYAHEAIVPRFLYTADTTNPAEYSESTAVIYAAPALSRSASTTSSTVNTPMITTSETTTTTETTSKPIKKRRHKKAKHYNVYRSPEEVHWHPTEPTLQRYSDITTPYPMVLPKPIQNHQYNEYPSTTMKPITNFKLTYKDEDSNFQIVYVDESLEKPIRQEVMPTKVPSKFRENSYISKQLPTLSSHYSKEKEYYAFPVYTLGKLLKPDSSEKPLLYSPHSPGFEDQKKSSENSVDTWFIMNSRYKGHRTNDSSKRLSSKYVEVTPKGGVGELSIKPALQQNSISS